MKDIAASRTFYDEFGFAVGGGNQDQGWLILKNDDRIIGLFQGMFDRNILTFNPGWDSNAKNVDPFTDVREPQRQLKARGVPLTTEADGDHQAAIAGNQCAGRVGFFLQVDDFDAMYQRMVGAGVVFVSTPRIEAYGKVAVFLDLEGNRWDLLGHATIS